MIRTVDVRVDVLRNGARFTNLKFSEPPIITMDNSGEIKSSFTGSCFPNAEIDWLSDQLQPVLVINGVEYHCGIFDPASIRTVRSAEGSAVQFEAYDKCWRVQSMHTEDVLHLGYGRNYLTVIKELLTEAGIALVIETPTTQVLRSDREDWEIGTDYLTIVNQLLREINYNELWFNNEGFAMLQPKAELSLQQVKRTYNSSNISSMMHKEVSTEIDLFNVPNVFICICSNPDDGTAMKAVAVNNNPVSPVSVIRRGRRISALYRVDNIASQSALNDYAQLLCLQNALIGETITIDTALIPNCGINETVAIIHPDASGLCYETGWTMNLGAGGAMQHKLQKVVSLS